MAASPTSKLLVSDIASVVDHVPSNYVRPISERPNLSNVETSGDSIPLIDLQNLHGPNRADIIHQFADACSSYGFFQIKNHGVPEETIKKMMNVAREFFQQPESERVKHYSADTKKTRALVLTLLEAISESLGLAKDRVSNTLGKHGQHMAINYYPPCPQPELTYGLPGHKDANLITILLQDEVSGLQVFKDGKWVAVHSIPNTFIVNLGDQMQVISNDKYKSVLHRAVVNSDKERISIPTFYCPSEDAVVGPAQEQINEEEHSPAVYRNFTYAEYFEKFWDTAFATESCIDSFKASTN